MFSTLFGIVLALAGVIGPLFYDPFWGLAIFSCFTHITPMQLHIEYFRVPLVLSLISILSYTLGRKYESKFQRWPLEFWLLLIMVGGMVVSGMHAYDIDAAWNGNGISLFFKFIIFYLLLVNIINSRWKFDWFINAQILSAAWMVYKCWDLRGTTGARFENVNGGIVNDGNQYAAALILLLPIVAAKVFKKGYLAVRIGAALGVFGMLMSIIITTSRGGFLGITALCCSFVVLFRKARIKLIFFLLAIGIAVSPFVPEFYVERISTIFVSGDEGELEKTSSGRLNSWALAVDLWKEQPILGVGLNNFGYYMAVKEGKTWGERGHVVHSIWLQPLAEGGVVVFGPFMILLILFFYRTNKIKKAVRGSELEIDISALQVGMFGFLVSATFVDRLFYEPIYWWSALGVSLTYFYNDESFSQKRNLIK